MDDTIAKAMWGVHGGPNYKDYNILGVYVGIPLFWEATMYVGFLVEKSSSAV